MPGNGRSVREVVGEPDLFGHPRQLWMLLTVTVAITYAFYGFRAYLAPYVAQVFYVGAGAAAAQQRADLLISGFFALMYATPIVGGYVADNILGELRSLLLALWLGVASLVLMSSTHLFVFEMGMALYALSAGLGVSLTVLIGRNYPQGDARREGGYTLYYLAVSLGSFIAPIVCADWVGGRFGYRWGFVAAAAGMAAAAVTFQMRHRRMRPFLPRPEPRGAKKAVVLVIAVILVLLYPTAVLLSKPAVLSDSMYALMLVLVLYFVVRCVRRPDRVQTQRYLALLFLFGALVLFWTLSFQGVTSLNFFARDHVDAPFDYTLFQAANPLFLLIFAPVLALLWPWLDRRGKDPSTPRKFGIGLLLVASSYGLMAVGIHYGATPDGKVGWGVLAGCYLLQTLGELALSPIGYSLVGLLAAPEDASLAMGGWFFGIALAYQLAGWIATLTVGSADDSLSSLANYSDIYIRLFLAGAAASVAYILASPFIKRLMHGVR